MHSASTEKKNRAPRDDQELADERKLEALRVRLYRESAPEKYREQTRVAVARWRAANADEDRRRNREAQRQRRRAAHASAHGVES